MPIRSAIFFVHCCVVPHSRVILECAQHTRNNKHDIFSQPSFLFSSLSHPGVDSFTHHTHIHSITSSHVSLRIHHSPQTGSAFAVFASSQILARQVRSRLQQLVLHTCVISPFLPPVLTLFVWFLLPHHRTSCATLRLQLRASPEVSSTPAPPSSKRWLQKRRDSHNRRRHPRSLLSLRSLLVAPNATTRLSDIPAVLLLLLRPSHRHHRPHHQRSIDSSSPIFQSGLVLTPLASTSFFASSNSALPRTFPTLSGLNS